MINPNDLNDNEITSVVADDLTSTWEITDSASKKWVAKLPNYDPETRIEFTSKEDVVAVMQAKLKENPNYWDIYKTADEQKVIDTPRESEEVRRKRDELLNKYEWAVTSPDLADDKKAEWKTYRQALRDLPAQSGFPWEADGMTWPTKPS
tara:strand:- start:100 stop:549 length:450 start_codon:yes stop_codon:yes gene_type:complete